MFTLVSQKRGTDRSLSLVPSVTEQAPTPGTSLGSGKEQLLELETTLKKYLLSIHTPSAHAWPHIHTSDIRTSLELEADVPRGNITEA